MDGWTLLLRYYGTCSNARTGNEVCRCRRFLRCCCLFVGSNDGNKSDRGLGGWVGIPVLARYWTES